MQARELTQIQSILQKQISNLSVPEIRDRLKNIFVEQESFLKRLLKCNNFDAFKAIQKDGEEVTTHLAELLDQLYEQKDEESRGIRFPLQDRKWFYRKYG